MLLLFAAALALDVHAAAAAADPSATVKAAFGNTVVITDPDGRSRKIWLKSDGTWTGSSRRGLALAGKWTERDEKVCLSQSKPALPGSACQAFPSEIGKGVEAHNPLGGTVQVKIVKGHKG